MIEPARATPKVALTVRVYGPDGRLKEEVTSTDGTFETTLPAVPATIRPWWGRIFRKR